MGRKRDSISRTLSPKASLKQDYFQDHQVLRNAYNWELMNWLPAANDYHQYISSSIESQDE